MDGVGKIVLHRFWDLHRLLFLMRCFEACADNFPKACADHVQAFFADVWHVRARAVIMLACGLKPHEFVTFWQERTSTILTATET